MTFLTCNGLDIGIADKSSKFDPDDTRDEGRSVSGVFGQTDTDEARAATFVTYPQTPTNAEALRGWINGKGHIFSFDTTKYSSKALGPSATGSSSISAVQKKFGTSSLLVASGSTANFPFGTGYVAKYTVVVWKWTGAAFTLYGIDSTGQQWKAGVTFTATGSDSVAFWAAMAGGSLTLDGQDVAGTNSAVAHYDQLIVVPYVMTAAQHAAIAAATAAYPGLPRTYLAGDVIPDAAPGATVFGRVTSWEHEMLTLGGVYYDNAEVLTFRVVEE